MKKVKIRYYINEGDLVTKLPASKFANIPIYKKFKCDYILRCHHIYLDIVFDNIPLTEIMHKLLYIKKINKT